MENTLFGNMLFINYNLEKQSPFLKNCLSGVGGSFYNVVWKIQKIYFEIYALENTLYKIQFGKQSPFLWNCLSGVGEGFFLIRPFATWPPTITHHPTANGAHQIFLYFILYFIYFIQPFERGGRRLHAID